MLGHTPENLNRLELPLARSSQLRPIASVRTHLSVADGTVLTEQGKPGDKFFPLLNGAAECYIIGSLATRRFPGDSFGEMALLDLGPRHQEALRQKAGQTPKRSDGPDSPRQHHVESSRPPRR